MTLSDLKACVAKVNLKGFEILEREHQLTPDAAKNTDAARVYPVPNGGSLMCHGQADRCFHGLATGGHGNPSALEKTIILGVQGEAELFHRVAVGAVLDIDMEQEGAGGPTEDDAGLPVILVVGINYGQQRGHNYVQKPPDLFENTGMRPRVASVVRLLIAQGINVQPLRGPYHLVAANFFPWITTDPWNVCTRSVLTEELLLRYFGWPNPLDFIVALIRALQEKSRTANLPPDKGLTHVIFHGAQNATMRGGLALTGQLTMDYSSPPKKLPLYRCYRETPTVPPLSDFSPTAQRDLPGPDVIFSDTLEPSENGSHLDNAVWLWQQDRRCSDASTMEIDS